jgi:hypothetical protein
MLVRGGIFSARHPGHPAAGLPSETAARLIAQAIGVRRAAEVVSDHVGCPALWLTLPAAQIRPPDEGAPVPSLALSSEIEGCLSSFPGRRV